MPKNLIINSELYALTFSSSDLEKIDLIKDNIKTVATSKISKLTTGNNHSLVVYKEVYEDVIDEGLQFIRINGLENDIVWTNKNNISVPCGYFQVANIKPKDLEYTTYEETFEYFHNLKNNTQSDVIYSFDYLTKTYNVSLSGFDYDEVISKFNDFILMNSNYPFNKIELVSRYGKNTNQEYPILSKKK